MVTFIREGCGYHDVTTLPEGGDFRRAQENIPVEVIRDLPQHKVYVKLNNGRLAVVRKDLLGETNLTNVNY